MSRKSRAPRSEEIAGFNSKIGRIGNVIENFRISMGEEYRQLICTFRNGKVRNAAVDFTFRICQWSCSPVNVFRTSQMYVSAFVNAIEATTSFMQC